MNTKLERRFIFVLCATSLFACGSPSTSSTSSEIDPPIEEGKAIELVTPARKETVRIIDDSVYEYLTESTDISSYVNKKADYQKPVSLSWNLADSTGEYEYKVDVSLNIDLSDSISFYTTNLSLDITNLFVGTKYFWKVSTKTGDLDSNIGVFYTEDITPRYLNVDGMANVRDIGGWKNSKNTKIAQGYLYRGTEMNNIYNVTEAGKKTLKEEMKIKTDIDLRSDREADNITSSPLGEDVDYKHFPTFDGYTNVTNNNQKENYKGVFQILSKPESYPVYLHCYMGADRTGTVACILETLMGVSEEDCKKDYELTTFAGEDDTTLRKSSGKYSFIQKNISMLYKADTLQKSVEKYMKEFLGLTQDEVNSIKNILSGKTEAKRGTFVSLA